MAPSGTHKIVGGEEWTEARKQLLAKEKAFNKARDELSRERRELPWERVDRQYEFTGPNGKASLADLFDGRSQLIVYHFMFSPEWGDEGCPSCSFWADNFNGIITHLNHRDVSFVAISRAPLPQLMAFEKRMGWSFKWLSSYGSDFNYDYGVAFPDDVVAAKGPVVYNYRTEPAFITDLHGLSVFALGGDDVYHTYSSYARGIDMVNGAYHYLDLVPKGRDEEGIGPDWIRFHDAYED